LSPIRKLNAAAAPSPEEARLDPLELYAAGIDGSDYVAKLALLLRAAVSRIGDLLDIGAGGGQLGQAIRNPSASWIAVEPAAAMQQRLRTLIPPPRLIEADWRRADLPPACADTVLAANMPAPLTDAAEFLARCRYWARRSVVWVVPAQNGPRGLCLAGCLPRTWHGEDETPGVEIVLRGLPPRDRPAIAARADWTFSVVTPDLARLSAYLADRLHWPPDDPRRPEIHDHLAAQAVPVDGGLRLSVPRASALLVWRHDS
jgi:SAM-dependent methyltransferase